MLFANLPYKCAGGCGKKKRQMKTDLKGCKGILITAVRYSIEVE
jgi:hypothetical protein